jgi:uncharacterized HAD superfamily protein
MLEITRQIKRVKVLAIGLIQEDNFPSIIEASKLTNTPLRAIESSLKSGKPARKGYIWEYT